MKDLTHYFADSFKTSETHPTIPTVSKEVTVNDVKVSDKSTKTNYAPKKRGKKKSKSASPNSSDLKKNKCELDVIKIKPPPKGTKGDLVKDNVQDIPKTSGVEGSVDPISEKIVNNIFDNSDSKKVDIVEPLQNVQETNDTVQKTESKVSIIEDDRKENNVNNEMSHVEKIDNSPDQSFKAEETEALTTQEDRKRKRKEKIKALAEKKGYSKRKQIEDKETEEMVNNLQTRKNVFTNVPKRDENQPEIVHKPPTYSLLNYFSFSTPEQRLKEEAAKCKISVKADVHTPKEGDTSNTTPNSTPKSRPKSSQSKKKKAEIKQALSQMDEIQFIRSESLSPPPVLQDKKKTNKPKWRIQFQSDNFADCGTDNETSSPKRKLKTQTENRKSEEVVNGNTVVLKAIENDTKSENSDTESTQLNHRSRSARYKARKKTKDKSGIDESIELDKGKKVGADKTKNTDSKLNDNCESSDADITIVKEIEPKRSAPEKIAPLFIKKRKLDPAVLEARRMFLQSDMSENGNRPTIRKPSPVRNPLLPFPQISHISQLDSETNSESGEIKFGLKSPYKYLPSLDVSKFNNITTINYSIIRRWITTFDPIKLSVNMEEALNEIESRCNDARTMWKSISGTAKAENPKESPKVRTSKRRSSGKKVVNTEEEKIIENIWIHKYKPRSIQEIVGNEQAATKLKTWLDKWKTSPNTNSFDSEDDFYSSDCSSSCSSSDYNQVAILLGPYGCGKTASVYAAAEELGYSVLEINASSRRTGKKIIKELEEATKSHRIKKSGMKQTLLKAKVQEKKIPQNSLILMEDVDIIFEEDEGFISAAYQLASNTKRPIVMTCSEVCSHLNKLAPQQILIQFQAAAGNRASALLELISLAETGRKLSLPCVENLLESGDLRKALLQLQYLLATGDSHVLPPIVDTHHRNGISLWQKVPHCLYKSAVKDSKRRKKTVSPQDSTNTEMDILNQIANDLENVSLISKLIELEDVSLHHRNKKSVMSLSLSEDMRPYSNVDSISSSIADWLTIEVIHKKEDAEQSSTKGLSSLLKRRKLNTGINSVLSKIASTTDQRIIAEDYLPSVRAICRAEEMRNSSNNKRGNRFFHYLHGTNLPTNATNVLSAACKILQEKSELVQ